MLPSYFQIYSIFVLCVNIQVNCVISREHTTVKTEILQLIKPRSECKFEVCTSTEIGKCKIERCRCTDFPKWEGIQCKDDYGFYHPTLLFNTIQYLSGRMFEGYRFRKFDLTLLDYYNVTFAENALEGILGLEQFEVKRSSIKVIPDFRFVSISINSIRIDSSCLTSLQGKHLQGLTVLTFLSFFNNSIQYIDPDVFKGTNEVDSLDLSYNLLTSIPPNLLYPMKNLAYFSVSHNNLLHVDKLFSATVPLSFAEDELPGYKNLYELHLQHNHIKSIGTLRQLEKLKILNISHNDIKFIKQEQMPETLRIISLSENPFKCDCRLQPFVDFLKAKQKNGYIEVDTGMCLRSNLRSRQQKLPNCPDMCSCRCTEYSNVFFMFVDCSSGNLSNAPKLLSNNLKMLEAKGTNTSREQRHQVIYPNSHTHVYLEDRVLGLSFENNSLDFLDATQLPSNLIQLLLSNNKLKRLPDSLFDNQLNLKQVSLSGNPWNCDCNALNFKKWLTSNFPIFIDFDNIRCGTSDKGNANLDGSVIWKLNDFDLCPRTDITLNLLVSLGLLTFAIICLSAVLIYKTYELNIKVFLYYHGLTFVKEELLDQDKPFDAFISFSHKDDEFVIKDIVTELALLLGTITLNSLNFIFYVSICSIVSARQYLHILNSSPIYEEIEDRDPNIRLCLHYRHFIPGEFISDNITRAVKSSKRTVLILSSNFLESEWCFLEFQTAHMQTLEDKVHRIIVITVGELPEDIDPTIKVYLNSTTYLTWGERNFWNKLLFILPSGRNVQDPIPRRVGDNEIVLNFSSFDL